ncbi:hypothetical protein ACNQVK_01230 [Mycobacterium sp. 134]|uniref:hypothetical protein n=1 Tax=Mycobacterium sp. 134 TaxID=3400425 RepID=UPI003AAE5241
MSLADESADEARLNLTREALESVVKHITDCDPPPTLAVTADRRDALQANIPGLEEGIQKIPHDPGCYQFSLSGRPWSDADIDAPLLAGVVQRIIDAGQEYHRSIGIEYDATIDSELKSTVESTVSAHGIFPEASPLIRLPDGTDVPSVGPGGRVTIGHLGHAVVGTAAIRPFSISHWAQWVRLDSIFAAFAGLLDAGLTFDSSFGYWERSWMELQDHIEPVYAFLVEDESSDYPMKRRITIPATTVES